MYVCSYEKVGHVVEKYIHPPQINNSKIHTQVNQSDEVKKHDESEFKNENTAPPFSPSALPY